MARHGTSWVALPGAASGLHVYLRFNPLLNGHGGGGTDNAGVETGFAGTSTDGLNELDTGGLLTAGPADADNVVQTVEL